MIIDFRRRLRGVIADLMGVAGDQKVMWTPSLPIVYIGNPKCGSSTIKHSLKQTQAAEYIRAGIAFERSEGPHEGDGCLKSRGLRPSACSHRFVFSCVRNPFTRALSGYLDKVAPRKRMLYPELRKRNVENFDQHLLALADFRSKRLNSHFRPQHINLDFPTINYDVIFYLENLSALSDFFARISPEFNLETFAPRPRSANSKLRDHYTNRAVKLVQEIYAQDFSLFGYSDNLDDVGVSPGECIVGDRIVAGREEVTDMASRRPARAARCRAFDATLRYHQLMDLRII
jgi:hypothetical protein